MPTMVIHSLLIIAAAQLDVLADRVFARENRARARLADQRNALALRPDLRR